MITQKTLTSTTKSDKVDTMDNRLDLTEVMSDLFCYLHSRVTNGTADQFETSFYNDNLHWWDKLDDFLDGNEFTNQDREDVMELWVSAKELQLL